MQQPDRGVRPLFGLDRQGFRNFHGARKVRQGGKVRRREERLASESGKNGTNGTRRRREIRSFSSGILVLPPIDPFMRLH